MNQFKVLVVDDEPDILSLLAITLKKMGLKSYCCGCLAAAKALLREHKFALCLVDMQLSDGDGMELVHYIQKHHTELPVAIITAYGNVEGAVCALKAGAFDYVSKPVDLQILRGLVKTALKLQDSQNELTTAQSRLVGHSTAMKALRDTISKVSRSQAPVLLNGPSGVGKELVARLIHEQSPRAQMSYVPVNCGAIPAELMESEFFGHIKGSFTGAMHDKQGLFQAAHGGTLFLDEVADLPIGMQVKLLRAVQEKAIKPVGGTSELPVDVRIISATHKELNQLVADGAFRQDLYYRINVIEVLVPSLAERRQDIPLLVEHILKRIASDQNKPLLALHGEGLSKLQNYTFPGNIRELENILERAAALSEEPVIQSEYVQLPVTCYGYEDSAENELTSDSFALDNYLVNKEKEAILQALEQHRWNKTQAAKALGLTFRALRYRLQKLGLD